ncbi:MAG: bifunctional copper resistance protein CopD/cytochrome c oxidase assembly protein [Microbacteriaceae bacterium]|nr:bifunctional copper resistance protein CopD/cytochrome c oxidase assembly protein [Microbacteriaceae bacterium]
MSSTDQRSSRPAARRGRDRRSPAELDRITRAGWSPGIVAAVKWGPLALLALALVGALIGLAIGGAAEPLGLGDPGPVVRWGLPFARMAYNLTAALTIGALVIAIWSASRDEPEFERSMLIAQGGAVAWTLATAISTLFTYLAVSSVEFSFSADFGRGMWFFLAQLQAGQLWLMNLVMVAILSTWVFASRSKWGTLLATLFALLCLWPAAAQGHAAGAANHETAVGGITLHYTAAAVWLGGLVVVAVVAGLAAPRRRLPLIERYSQLALVAFIITAFSGIVATFLNVGDLDRLVTTGYGAIVLTKIVLLIGLGAFGAAQRGLLIDRMRANLEAGAPTRRPFAMLLALELGLMGLVAGLSAALGRTATPQPQLTADQLAAPTPAQWLSGNPLPPPFEPARLLDVWNLDPLWTALVVMGMVFYLLGARRLRRRGDGWPLWRTISVMIGCLILLYNVNGALYVYGRFQFSFHMTEHMILSMIIPIFLVLGAPMTLLLRAVKPRKDGSMGMREWMLLLVHSKWAAFFSHPIVAGVNFALALLTFYYTPLFRWATRDHVGHMWMIAHFLIVGYLFVESIIGDDPSRTRAPYPMRLIGLILVMTFHAFFGIAVMTGQNLLVAEWYGATGRTWGPPTALEDQHLGGAIAWGLGEFPTVILAAIVAIQWSRSDTREQRRIDRQANRDADAELEAYNARLRALAERDASERGER